MEGIRKRWEDVKCRLTARLTEFEESSSQFNQFITRFTGLCDWLYEFHGQLQDELCVAIPHKASTDTISHLKARLQVSARYMYMYVQTCILYSRTFANWQK